MAVAGNSVNVVTLGSNATISGVSSTTTLTSSGNDWFSLYETDSDTSKLSGNSSSTVGGYLTTSSYSDVLTSSPVIRDWGGDTANSSVTSSSTLAGNGVITGGTITDSDFGIETATYSVSEVSVTTVSDSATASDTAAASNGSFEGSTDTGTLTDTYTLSYPTTLTATDGSTVTYGSAGVISGGTASDSLYETGSDSPSDYETGTVTTTLTSVLNENNISDTVQDSLTSTLSATDSAHDSAGGSTTLTQSDSVVLGSSGTISSGGSANTLWSSGANESYSLYETGNESDSSNNGANQGAGATSLDLNTTVTGSESPTVTTTLTTTLSSTQYATTTLGSNGTITGGSESDYFYETGNDSTASSGPGTNVHQFVFAGNNSDSATYTTTFSDWGTGADTFTLSQSDVAAYTTGGVMSSGWSNSTLTSYGTSTDTMSESGSRTVSWGSGQYVGGSYSSTETDSQSYSDYGSTSLAVGTDGTVSSGTDTSNTTQTATDSQAFVQTGSAQMNDPEGGAPFGYSLSEQSLATSYVYSSNAGNQSIGAGDTITGGGNSFTFSESNYDSHSINASTPSYTVNDTGTGTFNQFMPGTETYGTGGTVSGGSDSFTWAQSVSDTLVLTQTICDTVTSSPVYALTENDQLIDDFYDAGTDILGASDSILAGCDTYTWNYTRGVGSTVTDSGVATAFYVSDNFSDGMTQDDTGSSTLTTNGHIYATDTFAYTEDTGAAAMASQSFGSSGGSTIDTGGASDTYADTDSGTITTSDNVTTSWDSFNLSDSHSISGSMYESGSSGGASVIINDIGVEIDGLTAYGTSTSYGSSFHFDNWQSASDDFVLTKNDPNQYNGVCTDISEGTDVTTGTSSLGQSGSAYSYSVSDTVSTALNINGDSTYGTVVTGLNLFDYSSQTQCYSVTGPPATSVYQENTSSATEGGVGGGNWTQTDAAGTGYSAATGVVSNLGTSPPNSAEHMGTTPGNLDTSQGLVSALGGAGAHPLSFAGPEVAVVPANTVELEEDLGPEGSPTSWQSHPNASGIGYRRPSAGVASGSGYAAIQPSAGNQPVMDSGTSDGNGTQELDRDLSFDEGSDENQGVTQASPTPRAEQQITGLGGLAGLIGLNNPVVQCMYNGDILEGVMKDNLGPWGANIGHQMNVGGAFYEGPRGGGLQSGGAGHTDSAQSGATAAGSPGAGGQSGPATPPPQGEGGSGQHRGSTGNVDPLTLLAIMAMALQQRKPNPVPGSQTPFEPIDVIMPGPVPAGYIAPDLVDDLVEAENQKVRDQVSRSLLGMTAPRRAIAPKTAIPVRSLRQASPDQQLLDWYHAVMREVLRVGDALRRGGPDALSALPGYKVQFVNVRPGAQDFTYDAGPPINPTHFPALWPELAEAIQYSVDNYGIVGRGSILTRGFIVSDTGVPSGGAALNYRDVIPVFPGVHVGPPWTIIRPEVFRVGNMTTYATLIHEPYHDYVWGHGGMRNLLPTVEEPDGGQGTDAFTQFWNFLHNAQGADGNTLWQRILMKVGPPPIPLVP